ncbi:MAG: hypothetical protein PHY35_05970 [Candidatus Omnitrophica bacterium]|nr:hypothetical protein [Candidatus Omnitrophota bacterium]
MRKLLIIYFFFLIVMNSYAEEQVVREVLSQDLEGNLELHIVTEEKVSLMVLIDDKIAVNQEFNAIKGPNLGIAPHEVFFFYVEPGEHVLSAKTGSGKQVYQGIFSIGENKKWVVLSYEDIERTKGFKPFSMEAYDNQVMYE